MNRNKHYIGIDIGGTKIAVTTIAPAGVIGQRIEFPSRPSDPPLEVLEEIALAVERLYAQPESPTRADALAIGLSCGGPLDPFRGVIGPKGHNPPNLHAWKELPLTAFFEKRLGLKAHVENDASNLALAELIFGGGKHHDTFALLLVATGVGGGLVIDRHLDNGFSGNNSEFGHQRFDLVPATKTRAVTLRDALADPAIDPARKRFLYGLGLSTVINFFDPDYAVAGHPVAQGHLDALRAIVNERVVNPLFDRAHLVATPPAESSSVVDLSDPAGGVFGQIVMLETDNDTVTAGDISLENLVSGKGVVARYRRVNGSAPENDSAKKIFAAAAQGESAAQRAMDDTAFFIAMGLTNLRRILDVDPIFLCGGITYCANEGQRQQFFARIESALRETFLRSDETLHPIPTSLGPSAGDLSTIAYWLANARG